MKMTALIIIWLVFMKKYKILLETSGLEYKGEGETLEEAFDKLDVTWLQIKSKGMMTVNYGKNKIEKIFFLLPLRRMFLNKFARKLQIKRFYFLLNQNDSL